MQKESYKYIFYIRKTRQPVTPAAWLLSMILYCKNLFRFLINHSIDSLNIFICSFLYFIRLVFPELTEERRKELVKDVKKKGEAAKVAIRNIRRDANDSLKKANKNSEITEDELKDQQD